MRTCPYCAEEILAKAIKCKHCGERLDSPSKASGSRTVNPLGVLLFLVGLGLAVYFYAVYDTSVAVPEQTVAGMRVGGGRVNNLGLMQNRNLGMMAGGGMFLAGILLMALAPGAKRPDGQEEALSRSITPFGGLAPEQRSWVVIGLLVLVVGCVIFVVTKF